MARGILPENLVLILVFDDRLLIVHNSLHTAISVSKVSSMLVGYLPTKDLTLTGN